MERIGLVGAHWRRGLDALSAYSVPREARTDRLRELVERAGLEEVFLLVTCNRVEVAFVSPEPVSAIRPRIHEILTGTIPESGESERSLRAWGGEGAVEHLLLVAAGLDSARLGETEIIGQFREARDLAREAGTIGERLSAVLDAALRVGARLRDGSTNGPSLADLAIRHLEESVPRPATIALVGVSPMTERVARSLSQTGHQLLWVNRTVIRAEEAAAGWGGEACALASFVDRPPSVDAVVCATGSEDAVLDCAALEKLAGRAKNTAGPTIVDLAVPHDVDAEAARRIGLPIMTMEDIVAEAAHHSETADLAGARVQVDEALDRIRRLLSDRSLAPVLASVQQTYRHTALEGVERLFRRHLPTLDPSEQEAVRRWAETLARRLAHMPTQGLKRLAETQGMDSVRVFAEPLADLSSPRSGDVS